MNEHEDLNNESVVENESSYSENIEMLSESQESFAELIIEEFPSETLLNESQLLLLRKSVSQLLSETNPKKKLLTATEIKTEPVEPTEVAARHSSFPPRFGYEGKCDFKLSLSYAMQKRAYESATFSRIQSKLYIVKDYPFRTLCHAKRVPRGSVLRATLYYLQPEDAISPVLRCPRHMCEDMAAGKGAVEHVLQSFHESATYEKDEQTGRFSVTVPYPEPEELENKPVASFQFKLTCYSSCFGGGINRRPLIIYFTLENNKIELGRQMIEVKICACPTRDLKQEEKKYMKAIGEISEDATSNESTDRYYIETEDLKLYRFLICMKELYDSNNQVNYKTAQKILDDNS